MPEETVTVSAEPTIICRVVSVWRENGVWFRAVDYGGHAPVVEYKTGELGYWSGEGTYMPSDAF